MAPRGEHGRHHHGHHRERDEEARHHVAGLEPPSVLTR
jgi:hypothetical protein